MAEAMFLKKTVVNDYGVVLWRERQEGGGKGQTEVRGRGNMHRGGEG